MITADRAAFEWEPHVLKHKINEKLSGDPLERITITKVRHPTLVMNEVFDILSSELRDPQDLKSLVLL